MDTLIWMWTLCKRCDVAGNLVPGSISGLYVVGFPEKGFMGLWLHRNNHCVVSTKLIQTDLFGTFHGQLGNQMENVKFIFKSPCWESPALLIRLDDKYQRHNKYVKGIMSISIQQTFWCYKFLSVFTKAKEIPTKVHFELFLSQKKDYLCLQCTEQMSSEPRQEDTTICTKDSVRLPILYCDKLPSLQLQIHGGRGWRVDKWVVSINLLECKPHSIHQ